MNQNLVIQHEYYKTLLGEKPTARDVEADAQNAEVEGRRCE